MGQVIIRNLPETIITQLKQKAEMHGHSLEQELREILSREARLTPAEKLALLDSVRAMPQKPFAIDSAQMIREDRDSR
ncbi:MAG: FitA-like ribbon-helix-helix domain-containing protein [Pseudomonadota bacterium]